MQRWLKSITPDRHALEKLWCLRPFKSAVLDRGCWTFHRHSVTRAFALGLFIAFIPPTPLPVHLLTCVILGMLFRLNLPVLVATVFLSNPVTWLPQVACSIWVGAKLMGMDLTPYLRVVHHHHPWTQVGQLWAPLLLGALVLGSIAAGTGYVLAQFAWRARVLYHLRRRRARPNGAGLNDAGVGNAGLDDAKLDDARLDDGLARGQLPVRQNQHAIEPRR